MLESKLEYTVNELLKNKDPRRNKIYMDEIGELFLKLPYFKMLMEEYPDPDLGPLMFRNLLKHLIIQRYDPNSSIWEYNDKVIGVYIIITGEVKIFKPPNKSYLIRYKKKKKKEEILIDENNDANKNKKTLSGKYRKATKNLFTKNETIYRSKSRKSKLHRTSFFGKNTFLKKQKPKIIKSASSICLSTDIKLDFNIKNLNNNNNNNIEQKEYGEEISLTEKNYIFRELPNYRELDYIEHFGKMIGEDCLIQNLQYRPYGAETLTKCILGFLTSNDYHILFDKINSINKANIISFLYNLNYFNNKNNFVHKLYRGIKTILYSKGKYIYKQNDPFRNMFIIKKGNVNINIVKIIKIETDINPDLILGKKYKIINHINDFEEIEHFTYDRIFELKGEYYEKKTYPIVNYGVGEILGNIEHFGKIKNYICSAQCISNVELYEIDLNIYKRIESKENIEFLNRKTKRQLEFFKNRINAINLIHTQNNKEYIIGKDKFMKAYYHNNPILPLKEKEKEYINNAKNPIPIKIKTKNKKLRNTKISPFSSNDLLSLGVEDKNELNINSELNMNNNKFILPNNYMINDKESDDYFSDNNNYGKNKDQNLSIISSERSGKNKKYNRTNIFSVLNNEKNKSQKKCLKKREQECFGRNIYLPFSSLSPKSSTIKEKKIINFIRNANSRFLNKKKTLNIRTPQRNVYFLSNSKIKSNFSSSKMVNAINILKINQKLNLKDENEEENKNNNISKEIRSDKSVKRNNKLNNSTMIAFHGYRCFLPKKIEKKEGRDFKRFKSYKVNNLFQFRNKNDNIFDERKEINHKYSNKNIRININLDRNEDRKRKTTINRNIFKGIKILSFLE